MGFDSFWFGVIVGVVFILGWQRWQAKQGAR